MKIKTNIQKLILLIIFALSTVSLFAQNYCQTSSQCGIAPILDFSTTGGYANITNNNSGCNAASGYYYFANKSLVVGIGDSFVFTLNSSISPYRQYGYAIWIDYNADGDFDDSGEKVWSSPSTTNTQVVDTIVIPSSVNPGFSRMRVRSTYYSIPTDPCSSIYWGETEDYNIVLITPNTTDMGTEAIISPNVFSSGNNTLKARYRNNGSTTVTNFKVSYQLDNSSFVTESVNNKTIGPGSSYIHQFSTPLNITQAGSHGLKITVSDVNSSHPDSNQLNDTLYTALCTGMSGTFTIGSSGDYTTFNDAVNALKACGIAGNVTFNVSSGNFNEHVVISDILGLSSNASVTFIGAGKTATTLSNNVGGSLNAVVEFVDISYIGFENMKISNTASSNYPNAIAIKNGSEFITIENCSISASSTSVIVVESDNNILKKNNIVGGRVGIAQSTLSTNSYANNNKIIENTFSGQSSYCIQNEYQHNCQIQYNIISNQTNSATSGIFQNRCSGSLIDGNIIYPNKIGLRLDYENYSYSDSALISNNIIGNFNSSTNQTGIKLTNSWNSRIFHNTIVLTDNDTANYLYGALNMYSPIACKVMNNIFYTTGNSLLLSITGYGSTYVVQCEIDNNLYYSISTASKFYNNGTNYLDLSSFRNSTNFLNMPHDANSYYQNNIQFLSATDYHLSSNSTPVNGVSLGVLFDVDGDSRCPYSHTIGADESTFQVIAPVAGFSVEDTICVNTPISCVNHAASTAPLGHEWYLNSVFQSNDLNFSYTPNLVASYDTIMLITKSCGGVDTFTRVIYIDYPQNKPQTAFLASKNIINPFDEVQFFSMSGECPSNWEWVITPQYYNDPYLGSMPCYYYMNFTSKNSQNPMVKFEYPGKYSVCLIASNTIGSDTLCQIDYIQVIPNQYMCVYPLPEVQSAPNGVLYDDGGPNSDYGNGTGSTCDFLLKPCADTIQFTFSEFEVRPGDYLRVYDGSSSQGQPLWDVNTYGMNGLTGDMSNAAFDTTLIATSGNMYFEWQANTSGTDKGFIGEWESSASNEPPPVAKFECADTVCLNMPVAFQSLSSGQDLRFSWDFTNSGFTQSVYENPTFTFTSPGNYTVKLVVSNCGGDSSFSKNILVLGGAAAPTADFQADILNPYRTIDVVSFTDLSHANLLNPLGCIDYWKWSITPSTFSVVSGYPYGQNPKITFLDTTCYTVTLIAGYNNSYDTITRSCYIDPNDYCIPVVRNLNTDLGISAVEIGSILNYSTIGQSEYTDYASNHYTYLDESMQYVMSISRITNLNAMTRKVWIDYNIDGDFDDPGELVLQEASTTNKVFTDSFIVPQGVSYGTTRMRIGVCISGYPNTACGPNFYGEYEDYRVILRPYSVPPAIVLNGPETIYTLQCDGFVDPGATASSFLFGSLTSQIITTNNVDPNYPGTYYINYQVSDPYGNTAIKTRNVWVLAEGYPPSISLNGPAIDSVNVFTSYVDPGVTAFDSCSGMDRVEVVGKVFSNFLGVFNLTYEAYDKNQNMSSVSRTVHVVDKEAPTIQLKGLASMNIHVYDNYQDSGVLVSDNYDPNPVLQTMGSVNTSFLGSYNITYSCQDSSGNQASLQRIVHVIDTMKPAYNANYNDKDTIYINVFTNVFDQLSISWTDNYGTPVVVQSGSYISEWGMLEANDIGYYTLNYVVTDSASNTTSLSFVVSVEDKIKPVLNLVGSSVINIKQWKVADTTDLMVTVSDNYDPDPLVWVSGDYYTDYLIHQRVGFYNVVYHAKDQSNNLADSVVRYVNVLDNVSLNESSAENGIHIYPNPAKDVVYLSFSKPINQEAHISVLNHLGQQVYLHKTQKQLLRISTKEMAAGMYFIRIEMENISSMQKLIIAK
jgi:PKD repeat protein